MVLHHARVIPLLLPSASLCGESNSGRGSPHTPGLILHVAWRGRFYQVNPLIWPGVAGWFDSVEGNRPALRWPVTSRCRGSCGSWRTYTTGDLYINDNRLLELENHDPVWGYFEKVLQYCRIFNKIRSERRRIFQQQGKIVLYQRGFPLLSRISLTPTRRFGSTKMETFLLDTKKRCSVEIVAER